MHKQVQCDKMYSEKNDWEFLQEDKNLLENYTIKSNYNVSNISSCYLKRDDDYNIIFVLASNSAVNFDQNKEPLAFILENELHEISFPCILQTQQMHYDKKLGFKSTIQFKANNVEIIYKSNIGKEVAYIKEYYLNSITDKLLFSRVTQYFEEERNYHKVRETK